MSVCLYCSLENRRSNHNTVATLEQCYLECDLDFLRVGRIRKNCTCDENDEGCHLIPSEPAFCEPIEGTLPLQRKTRPLFFVSNVNLVTSEGYQGLQSQNFVSKYIKNAPGHKSSKIFIIFSLLSEISKSLLGSDS